MDHSEYAFLETKYANVTHLQASNATFWGQPYPLLRRNNGVVQHEDKKVYWFLEVPQELSEFPPSSSFVHRNGVHGYYRSNFTHFGVSRPWYRTLD